jgi:signal transduction histidine kinase/ActR/RegA family two-component response regulator
MGMMRRRDDPDPSIEWQSLVNKLPGMVFRLHCTPLGRWTMPMASNEVARVCGVGLKALREDARCLETRIHPDDLDAIRAAHAHQASSRTIRHVIRIRRPDGPWMSFEAIASAERAHDGGCYWNGLLAPCPDAPLVVTASSPAGSSTAIDAVAVAPDDIGLPDDRWRRATALADMGVVEINADEGWLDLDPIACRHHGLESTRSRWTAEDWLERISADDREAARALLSTPSLAQDRLRIPLRIEPTPSRTLEFLLERVEGSNRLIGTCVDVTRRKALETLQHDKLEAEKASRSKSEFMSRVSHELRTPLNGILGFAQLMALDREHPLSVAQAQRLDVLRQSGSKLLSLIDQLLEVSRIEQGKMRLRNRPIDVRLLVERCAVEVMPLAQDRGIEILVEIPADSRAVRADPDALEQVVTNLLSNAIKYNRPKGRIRVRFESGEQGVLTVDDTGIGMSQDQIDRLFEPFNRLGAERSDTQGSGLGLVITRKLVKAMGGKIEVLSRPGRGTRFAVSLPMSKTRAAALPPPLEDQRPPEFPALAAKSAEQVVLYVEDDEVNTILMEQIFSSHPNWRLLTASNGPEGLEMVRHNDLALVLLDLNLPGLSGFEVLEKIRASESTRHLRCIALSADALPQQIRHALAQGFDDYWTKPIDVASVVAKLHEELRPVSESG